VGILDVWGQLNIDKTSGSVDPKIEFRSLLPKCSHHYWFLGKVFGELIAKPAIVAGF